MPTPLTDADKVLRNDTGKDIVEKLNSINNTLLAGSTGLASRVIADAYDSTQTYSVGDYVIYDNLLYRCITAISVAEDWTPAHWVETVVTDELGSVVAELVPPAVAEVAPSVVREVAGPIVEELVPIAVGNNYYNKTETDTKIAGQIDDTQVLSNKTWSSEKTSQEITNVLPTKTASGSIASINASVSAPLVNCVVDESATKVTKCGVNIFDEQMELGGIFSANGQPYASSNRMRSKNFIKVNGGDAIYFYLGGAGIIAVLCCYNENKEYISDVGYNKQNSAILLPDNAKYIRFQMSQSYGTTYNNDISVCYPANNTSYSAYSGVDYPVADVDKIVANSGINNIFADVGDVSVAYRVSLDDSLSEKANANIDTEDISFSDVTTGKYINNSGSVDNSASFAYTKPINIIKGDTITFEACGYQTNVSMIAKFNGTSYTPLVISVDNTLRTYTYIATENMSISLSYKTTEVHSATLKRNLMTGIDNLNNEVEALKNKGENLFSIFETFGACGDSLISGVIEVASGIIEDAVTNYNLSWAKQISDLCQNDYTHYSRGGLTSKAWLNNFASTVASKDAYFVALGTNDFTSLSLGTSADIGTSADTFYRYYGDIISLLKSTNPNASIFVCSLYRNEADKTNWNNAIKYFADNNSNVYYVDLTEMTTKYGKYKNGSHFSAVGYKLIALDVLSELDEIIVNNWSDFRYVGTYS